MFIFSSDPSLRIKQIGLVCALVGVARATDGAAQLFDSTYESVFDALQLLTDCQDNDILSCQIDLLHEEKYKLVPNCRFCANPCGRTFDLDFSAFSDQFHDDFLRLLDCSIQLSRNCSDRKGNAGQIYRLLFYLGENVSTQDVDNLLSDIPFSADL